VLTGLSQFTAQSVAASEKADGVTITILSLAAASTLAAAASTAAGRAGSPGAELAALADARHILLGAPVATSVLAGDAAAVVTARLRRRNRRAGLRRAAGRLATCVLRTGDCTNAAMLFAASDRPLGEVFRALQAHTGAVDATLRYLDAVLFEPVVCAAPWCVVSYDADHVQMHDVVVPDDGAISSEVLQFYATHAPDRLSLVILESALPVLPAQALQLLEPVTARGQSAPADLFAKALLYMVQ
jgi:hypothetical protein